MWIRPCYDGGSTIRTLRKILLDGHLEKLQERVQNHFYPDNLLPEAPNGLLQIQVRFEIHEASRSYFATHGMSFENGS